MENLEGFDVRINFSGGDPLVVKENMRIIRRATQYFGKDNLSISTTGYGLSFYDPSSIIPFVGRVKTTFDAPSDVEVPYRPNGYNKSNLVQGKRYARAGAYVVVEIPISRFNHNPNLIENMYSELHEAGISEAYIMKSFPVGRWVKGSNQILADNEYTKAIEIYRRLEKKFVSPKLSIQYALQDELVSTSLEKYIYRGSFGITPKGLLLTNAWALKNCGDPLGDEFVLGDMRSNRLEEILKSQRARDSLTEQRIRLGQNQVIKREFLIV
ncbi:MAG: hypothetical protein AABX11_02655 [Nanoarchaeota archaeon]